MTEKQVRDYDKFMLRFPDGMRDAIAKRAKQNGRSMNSEIVQILEDALNRDPATILMIDELENTLTPHVLDKENGLAAQLRMMSKMLTAQADEVEKLKQTPLETLRQNRPDHKSRKDK